MVNTPCTLRAFRKDPAERFWRLHWFGGLTGLETPNPSIEITLVPPRDPGLDPFTAKADKLLDESAYDYGQKRTVLVPVTGLPHLPLGVFLRRGRPVYLPGYRRATFDDLFISSKTARVIPLRTRRYLDENRWVYMIPFTQYDLEGVNYDTKCFVVDLKDPHPSSVTKLIIPCVEVVRFYYANSRQLFREIFNGGLVGRPNRVFNESRTRPLDVAGKGFVQLSKYVRDIDAPYVARLAYDQYALAKARTIYTSAKRAERIRHAPEAVPPFKDLATTLVVHGKPIQSGEERYFLVYWIESCSAPFPFRSFEYERDNSGIKVSDDPDRKPAWVEREEMAGPIREATGVPPTAPASLPHERFFGGLNVRNKFPDLSRKTWKKRKKTRSLYRAATDDERRAATAHGDTPGGGDTEHRPNRPAALPPRFELFRQIVSLLNDPGEGLYCEVIEVTESGPVERRESYSPFPGQWEGRPLPWSFRGRGRGKRARQVAIARGMVGSHYYYLLEIEPDKEADMLREGNEGRKYKQLLLYRPGLFGELDADDLRKVLAFCSRHEGTWLEEGELEQFGRRKIMHRYRPPARHARRVIQLLEEGGWPRSSLSPLSRLAEKLLALIPGEADASPG